MGDVGKLVLTIKKEEDDLSKANVNSLLETKRQIKTSDFIQEPNKILIKYKLETTISINIIVSKLAWTAEIITFKTLLMFILHLFLTYQLL